MSALIDYTLDRAKVHNPGGSRAATFTGVTVVAGPGHTALGNFPKALDLGTAGKAKVDLAGLTPDAARFTVQVALKVDALPASAQTVLASTLLPFSLTVERSVGTPTGVAVVGRVTPAAGAKQGASTTFATAIAPGTWHVVALAYDTDTIGVYVDGALQAVHAFPNGAVTVAAAGSLFLGTDAQGGSHFGGALAAVRWSDDVPADLEALLDARRTAPEWYLSYKDESLVLAGLDLGDPRSPITWSAAIGASTQAFQNGLLMYSEDAGVAFEMHGAIWQLYAALADTAPLGALVSDETNSRAAGGRKSLFTSGGIYWSAGTGAFPVVGHLYLSYERLNEAAGLGFPTAFADAVPGGLEQVFQNARLYLRAGASVAHELHGAILGHFLATGATGTWGFPLTDESDVVRDGTALGRYNELENCTIYWSGATGAFEVHGDIRRKYRDLGGPGGQLGFPTSDEGDIPGAPAPARFNTFQNGSLLWFGTFDGMIVATSFSLFLSTVNTVESEGLFMGQNDVYLRAMVADGAAMIVNQRWPASGDSDDHNVVQPNLRLPAQGGITTNRADQVLTVTIDVWDSDDGAPFGGGDDHLGTWTTQLTMANGWGLRESGGVLHSGHFSNINDIVLSVQPTPPPGGFAPNDHWWAVQNKGTQDIAFTDYATAFSDVDSDPEWWDLDDDLDRLFYALVVDGLARGGNCFGMSLESIYADKGQSAFSLPLSRFRDWDQLRQTFNVKHQYQVGSAPIWWFVDQFVSGRTHDPKAVFLETQAAAARGDDPVLCLAQNADFSGAPHCIRPIGWDTSTSPWTITVHDPNFPSTSRTLQVDPNANTFHYAGAGATYDGTSSSGGRLHYMPFHLLSSREHTPVWDAILLILAGTVLILGSDAETVSLTDAQGNDLDAFGSRAGRLEAAGAPLDDLFFGVHGFNAGRLVPGAGASDAARVAVDRAAALRPVGTGPVIDDGPVHGVPVHTGPIHTGPVVGPVVTGTVGTPAQSRPVVGELRLRRRASVRDVTLGVRPPIRVVLGSVTLKQVAAGGVTRSRVAAALAQDPAVHGTLGDATVHEVVSNPKLVARLGTTAQAALGALQLAAASSDYVHQVRAVRAGSLDYAVRHGLSKLHLTAPVASGETASLALSGVGTARTVLGVTAQHDKAASLRIDQKLGVTGDSLRLTLDGVPLTGGQAAQINAKPGIGGVEVVSGGAQVDVTVSVEAVVGGRSTSHRFSVPLQDGVRIDAASVLAAGGLGVSRIGQVFGPSLSKSVLPSQ
ncbi:LamG-like jellyroll fold domain-containing protein [Luteimicrobium sp. DT211]|uniref:LamG-like jellyroll fold domain-containing protein n=1 Tax=Luteimicrobium sp. DT211 TaxID=3393412 RepID=UPI003CF80606